MAETMYPDSNKSITLSEFIDFTNDNPMIKALKESKYDFNGIKTIAYQFAALAKNRSFLPNLLIKQLEQPETFQQNNTFKPSTLIIHQGEGYTLRAVIWMPLAKPYPPEVFSYFEPHDHNFDFFTANYFGPGYKTKMYHYDYEKTTGIPGEEVDLKFVEDTYLTPDKVMYYYANYDAHIQYPPESLTVSLNLILPKTYPAHRRQYEFKLKKDSNKAEIILGGLDRYAKFRSFIEAAIGLNDERIMHSISKLSREHNNAQIRAIAWDAILKGSRNLDQDLALAFEDQDAYVRAFLEKYK